MSGRGTFSGTVFQTTVGACVAGLLLAERPLSRLGFNLPGTPQQVLLETPTAVDDVHIITDAGQIFVQAKNSLTLSTKPDSELASVANQFVRQYREGVQENSGRRDLSAVLDRLVLAVGEETPTTITSNLREALERNRTGAATSLPSAIAEALRVFTAQLETAWLAVAGIPLAPADRQALLALCSVAVIGNSQRQVVEEGLTAIVATPGAETTLFDLLLTWAADAAQRGTGGDEAAIRQALQGRISLAAPPSFHHDLARLRAYSVGTLRQLERFTALSAPEGIVRLTRPVAARVVEAAQLGTLALTGEPGAGKSAVLFALAGELQQHYPVVCLTVETGAGTLDLLRAEIGLHHPLVDVLRHLPRSTTAYLLLDALDASRGGAAEPTYRKLIEAVTELPGWCVVASVRSFDLRLGVEWQRLFRGPAPFPEYADASFPLVRHLHLGLLTHAERADLARQSPSLDAALTAGGSKLETLAHNPFNLALLAELLTSGTLPQDLAAVTTRGQLLARYWYQRVESLGTPAVVALAKLLEQMLQAKALTVPRARVAAATAVALDHLHQAGVLVLASSGQIGFRHHVLFDYAVATLLLPVTETAPAYLRREQAAGLLLAPALGYWVEELKRTRQDFWAFIADLIADEALDPLVRVEVARLAVETVEPDEELTELAAILNGTGELATRSFQQLAGALLTKAEARQPFVGEPWAHLLSHLALIDSAQLWRLQALLGALLNQPLGAGARASLGTAARTLYARVAAQERLTQWLSRLVIPHVVRTYSTDPVASRQQLSLVFSPERFERFGHLEVPEFARAVLALAASDADFTVELFTRVFQRHNFSRDQTTPKVQSWIFALTSNAAQDYDLAQHHLAKAFPALLQQSPVIAVRAFAATLRGRGDARSWHSNSAAQADLPVGGVLYRFEEDGSSMWAWELEEGRHTAFAKIHDAFMQWVSNLQNQGVLNALPGWLLSETPLALAWRVLFAAGVLHPQTLGPLLWPAATQQPALVSFSTQQSATQLLAASYPHLNLQTRTEAEAQWLQWDFATFADPASKRVRTLGPLLEAIGEAQLVTDAARDFLRSTRLSTISLRNESSFSVQRGRISESSWFEAESEQIPVEPWRHLLSVVKTAQTQAQADATPEAVARLEEVVQDLDQVVSQLPADEAGADEHVAMLAEGLAVLVQLAGEATSRTAALTRLLELTHYPAPTADADTETRFAAGGIQPYIQGRTEVAAALAGLVAVPQLWPRIAARVESMLLYDPHPEVRWRLLASLPELESIAAQALWDLAEKFVHQEQNPALCQRGLSLLQHLVHLDSARAEPLVIALIKKVDSGSPRSAMDTSYLVLLALDKALPASWDLLQSWIADYASRKEQLSSVLFTVQDRLVVGYGPNASELALVRTRAIALVVSLITAVEPAIVAWIAADREPTAEEITAVKLLDEIAEQLFFAVSADGLPPSLAEVEAQRQFLRDYSPLIRKLSTLGTPNAVHHLLEVLSQFVTANPADCFDLLSEAILRTTGVAKYEHESLGAARFVELISRYLADYRFLFDQPARQKRLIDCIAVFVEAGWPEACLLFYALPGLLQ